MTACLPSPLGIVFYGLLAFFPAITALVSIYGLLADPATIRDHLSLASGFLPAGGFDILREQVDRILAKGGGKLSFAFVLGTLLAIWSANAGMKAMIDALNVIYNVPETAQLHPAQRGFAGAHRRRYRDAAARHRLRRAIPLAAVAASASAAGADSFASLLRWPLLFVGVMLGACGALSLRPEPAWREMALDHAGLAVRHRALGDRLRGAVLLSGEFRQLRRHLWLARRRASA